MINLVYNRTSMNAAVKFLRANNPAAAKYSELGLIHRIEGMMVDLVESRDVCSSTLGFILVYNVDVGDSHVFDIYVDAGVCQPYEEITVSLPEYS